MSEKSFQDANNEMDVENGVGIQHMVKPNKRPLEKNEETEMDCSSTSTNEIPNSKVAEEDKFYCSYCSLKLNNDNDAKNHYVGKKHIKALAREEARKKLESRSVFVFGSNSMTKPTVEEYFKSNFGPVADVKMTESRHTCAIIEFDAEETAKKVLTTKKHQIDGFWYVAKPRLLPKESSTIPESVAKKDPIHPSKVVKFTELEDKLNNLSFENIQELHESLKLSDEDVEKRISIAKDLTENLKNFISGDFSVELYGSSLNGFGWKDSDLDMTLIFTNVSSDATTKLIRTEDELKNIKLEQISTEKNRISYKELKSLSPSACLKLLKKLLDSNARIKNLLFVDGIRCPLVQFFYENDYFCEISFENRLALNNSNWLKFLASKFPFLTLLSSILRLWATKNGLLLKYRHCFNGYTLLLMLITFLQTKKFLPTVEDLRRPSDDGDEKNFIDGWNCDWNDSVETLSSSKNEIAMDLLKEFFELVSTKTLRFYVFIPRIGQILCVDRFFSEFCTNADADRRSMFPISEINIQDPFVLNHNIASKIAPKFVQILKNSSQFISTTCNQGETIAKALLMNFQPSPMNDDHFFESKMKGKVSLYSFVLKPTIDDVNRFGRIWLMDFRANWTRDVVDGIKKVLSEIMLLELDELEQKAASICAPSSKRAKIEPESVAVEFECKTMNSAWIGRKQFQHEKNCESDKNLFEIEKEISAKLLDEERKTLESQPLNFVLNFETNIDDDFCYLKLNFSCSEKNQFGRFTTFCTFFRSFIRKMLPHFLKI